MSSAIEPILDPKNARINLYPIMYPDIWDMYEKQKASFWVEAEIDLSSDKHEFESLEEDEKHFLLNVLSFFAASDLIVNENLDTHFVDQVQIPELRFCYQFQEMMENIHTNVYQILIETLVPNAEQKRHLLQSTFEIDSIKAKAEWAKRWINTGNFVQRLIAFAIVEGIFFSASFCSIFWIKKRGILKGVAQSNNFISRDEGMHRDVAILIYRNHIVNKLPTGVIKQMIQDAVQVESQFVNDCLPYKLEGMNADMMNQYVKFVADHLCVELIGERIYSVSNPFPWMNLISVESKANFFERKVVEYQKGTNRNSTDKQIVFDEEF